MLTRIASSSRDAPTLVPRASPMLRPEGVAVLDRAGVAYAVAAFGAWGLVPLFWKQLTDVPSWEILLYRVVWAAPVFALVAWWRGDGARVVAALGGGRAWAVGASAALLAANWLSFLVAIETDRVLDVSLGYFLNPLLSVLLGRVVLGERLAPRQAVAVGLAAAGVVVLCTQADAIPWTGLAVAVTFGVYGLVRKLARVEAVPGSTAEVVLLVPLALVALFWLSARGDLVGPALGAKAWLLPVTGLVTALPSASSSSSRRPASSCSRRSCSASLSGRGCTSRASCSCGQGSGCSCPGADRRSRCGATGRATSRPLG
jgi:chloramphenicol-sensitive protein RarD